MCSYSTMGDIGRGYWPHVPDTIQPWIQPQPIVIEVDRVPTPKQWEAFKELVRKAKAFDEAVGTPGCECEDIEKTAWIADMEQRMQELEDWQDRVQG